MHTYTLKLFKARAGTSIRMGDGQLHFDVGDDLTAIRYAETNLNDALSGCDFAELWSADERLVWEKSVV